MDVKQIEKELDSLEQALLLLKRDYEIYFSGGSKLPPLAAHQKLEREVRKYSGLVNLNYAQRFRYNNINARFNSYADLWSKQLRYREEGRTPSGAVIQVPETAPKSQSKKKPDLEADRIQQVFNDYLKCREETSENSGPITFEKFAQQVMKQKQAILGKYECKDVEFYVAVEGGKTKLKAKPVK